MRKNVDPKKKRKRLKLPHIGMRIVKTGICVFFCLLLNYFFGAQMSILSAIASIIVLEPTLENTLRTGLRQLLGAAIGGGFGMLLIPLTHVVELEWLYILLMPLGLMLDIYLCILMGMRESATVSAFAYVAVLIVPYEPADSNPYMVALSYILDTGTGVIIAVLVNRFVAPPVRRPRSIHLPSNAFRDVYERVHTRLTGDEELILLDSSLTGLGCAPAPTGSCGVHDGPFLADRDTVQVPVPIEFRDQKYIQGTYITRRYAVLPFYIRNDEGYIDIPWAGRPLTVVWSTGPESLQARYGIMPPIFDHHRSLQPVAYDRIHLRGANGHGQHFQHGGKRHRTAPPRLVRPAPDTEDPDERP